MKKVYYPYGGKKFHFAKNGKKTLCGIPKKKSAFIEWEETEEETHIFNECNRCRKIMGKMIA